jgi:hypothetical protein
MCGYQLIIKKLLKFYGSVSWLLVLIFEMVMFQQKQSIVIDLKQVKKLLTINWTSGFVLPLIEGDAIQWLLVVSSSHRSLNWHSRCTLRSHTFGWILFFSITNFVLSVPVFSQSTFINWQFHILLAVCVLNDLCLHSLYLPVYCSYEFLFWRSVRTLIELPIHYITNCVSLSISG